MRFCDALIIVGEKVMPTSGSTSSTASGSTARATSSTWLGILRRRADNGLEERGHLRLETRLRRELRETLDQPRRLHERVVRDPGRRRVPAAAVNAQHERRAHLLRGRGEVERPLADHHAVAGALVERVLGANRLGMLLAEPGEPEVDADLLVGGRDEDQVAAGLESLPGERGHRHRARRDLALHVERAAAPDLAVAKLARPGVDLPLGGIGENRVRVREERQPRPVAAPGNPRDEVRPLRHLRVELAGDAVLLEVVAQELGRTGLVPGRVDRVEADQLLEELADLVAERDGCAQRRVPCTSTHSRLCSIPPLLARSVSTKSTQERCSSSRFSSSSESESIFVGP